MGDFSIYFFARLEKELMKVVDGLFFKRPVKVIICD
jgi:hypothetical protein